MWGNNKTTRWTVLLIVAIIMMMGYVFWDIVSPLTTNLKSPLDKGGMNWTTAEYGFYAGSYSIFNIFLFMLFFGGIILDKMGIRFTGILATGMMLCGALINYIAIKYISALNYTDLPLTLFGLIPQHIKLQVLIAALGFGLFGVGCDITGITVSKVITKWFTGHELASAMGIQVALARLGTASAISFSPIIALNFGGIQASLLVGTILLLLGFILFFIYNVNFDGIIKEKDNNTEEDKEPYNIKSIITLLKNINFWFIALLCVSFYSSIRPFLKFATDIIVEKYNMNIIAAGWITSILPYGTIILTPLFGYINDKYGYARRLLVTGCLIVVVSLLLLLSPIGTGTAWMPIMIMVMMGIAFSLVPSVLWPTVPKLVPLKQLGTAYSIIYYIQNLGLMLVPMTVGNIVTSYNGRINYTPGIIIFTIFAVFATIVACKIKK
ncbi:MAG: MFS transporter [Prevotella sp.]|jgi:nitrate/nitrite transporter NarK|nr:MFS transporter [Prevotella sp.]MBP8757144.1 MFS transporter [Prevotella sp.]